MSPTDLFILERDARRARAQEVARLARLAAQSIAKAWRIATDVLRDALKSRANAGGEV